MYGPLAAIWALALTRALVDPTPRVPLLFNWTPSLPYQVAWLTCGPWQYARGDFVVFLFAGEAEEHYPGLKGQPFFKIVSGVAGDVISVRDRAVFVNGEAVGFAKTHAFDGRRLEPIAEGVIPPGWLYVRGTDANSFDSRYRSAGLVRIEQIIGRVRPLL